MSDNAKFGYLALTTAVLANIVAVGNKEKVRTITDQRVREERQRIAASADAVAHVAAFAALVALYRSGWKKTAGVGTGLLLGGLAVGAYSSQRKWKGEATASRAAPPMPTATGYFPHGPSAIPSYPATPFASDPLYTQYPQW